MSKKDTKREMSSSLFMHKKKGKKEIKNEFR